MSIGIIGDVHASDRAPASRAASYRDDILHKLHLSVAALTQGTHKVDVLLFVGDMFHIKAPSRVSHYLVNQIIKIFSLAESAGVRILVLPGNHDLFGDNEAAIDRQPLATLGKLPHVTILTEGSTPWKLPNGHEIGAIGTTKDIVVAHLPIVNDNKVYPFPTIHARELDGEARFIIYGHMHEGPNAWTGERTRFVSPGALARVSVKERDRQPKVLILSEAEEDLKVKSIDIPIRPADEVFIEALHVLPEERSDKLVSSLLSPDLIAAGPEEIRAMVLKNAPPRLKELCETITAEAFSQ